MNISLYILDHLTPYQFIVTCVVFITQHLLPNILVAVKNDPRFLFCPNQGCPSPNYGQVVLIRIQYKVVLGFTEYEYDHEEIRPRYDRRISARSYRYNAIPTSTIEKV